MKVFMDFKHIRTLDDIRLFLKGSRRFVLKAETIEDKYEIIDKLVSQLSYHTLTKKDKWIVLKILKLFTGYKQSQLHQLIKNALSGNLSRKPYQRMNIYRKYTGGDIKLLEQTDELHYRLSATATHEIMRREYALFHHVEYKNIAHISISHINNLRDTNTYKAKYLAHTQVRQIPIGETTKPEANGLPGSIRIDSVSQSDVYYINAVDEITQWEVMVCVPRITEYYMEQALKTILVQFPFTIFNFHSDRGSEFINRIVARLLHKLLIHQTKSRARHTNDNALVETKNGSVIRKNLGFFHINQKLVSKFNEFFTHWFNPYLNYHRPCGYVTETIVDFKGREKKIYGEYTTPYEKLKELIHKNKTKPILKPDVTFETLDIIAYSHSDNEFATIMRTHQYELFDINSSLKSR